MNAWDGRVSVSRSARKYADYLDAVEVRLRDVHYLDHRHCKTAYKLYP